LELRFRAARLATLAPDSNYTDGLPPGAVAAFRMRMQALQAATDERDLVALDVWLHLTRLSDASPRHSMLVTAEWQLIVEFGDGDDERVAVIEAMVQLEKTTKEHRS
jgi:plasmid maintenance system killer protein